MRKTSNTSFYLIGIVAIVAIAAIFLIQGSLTKSPSVKNEGIGKETVAGAASFSIPQPLQTLVRPDPVNCDQDEDGYRSVDCYTGTDCDDSNPHVHPDIEEICGNNIDDNCRDGDIGLCQGTVFIQPRKSVYTENEEVQLQ